MRDDDGQTSEFLDFFTERSNEVVAPYLGTCTVGRCYYECKSLIYVYAQGTLLWCPYSLFLLYKTLTSTGTVLNSKDS